MGLGLRDSLANASAGTTNVSIYLLNHYRAEEAASQRKGGVHCEPSEICKKKKTAPDLISESLIGA